MSSAPTSPSLPLDSSFTNEEAEERIDVNRVLRSLADPRRREILGLLEETPEWTRAELVEGLRDIQGSADVSSESDSDVSSASEIETGLLHKHLPTLEQADLVSLEGGSWLVQRGESYGIVRDMAEAAASVTADD